MLPADGGGEGFIPQTEQFLPWKTCNANIGFVTVMCQPGSARHTSYSSHTDRLNMLSKYWLETSNLYLRLNVDVDNVDIHKTETET